MPHSYQSCHLLVTPLGILIRRRHFSVIDTSTLSFGNEHYRMPKPAVTLGGGRGGVKGVSQWCQDGESTDRYFPGITDVLAPQPLPARSSAKGSGSPGRGKRQSRFALAADIANRPHPQSLTTYPTEIKGKTRDQTGYICERRGGLADGLSYHPEGQTQWGDASDELRPESIIFCLNTSINILLRYSKVFFITGSLDRAT